jgi:DNA helicase-2/ATP-dependent DNA helicase PcrA
VSDRLLAEITDADISWACKVMGLPEGAFDPIAGDDSRTVALKDLDTVDVEACPGSGKTTLLVAKLAILANRWTSRRQGICVLSHTNAARHEIGSRLSSCAAGGTLLRYPHFVGTIHSFVNEFLAMPWLRSKGVKIKAIDTDVALERRWRVLPWSTRSYLEKKWLTKSAMEYTRADFTGFDIGNIGQHTETFRNVLAKCAASCAEGYFCYDEMFVWAAELLDRHPEIVAIIRTRFPVVFIDEAQDNDKLQSAFLQRLFCLGDRPVIRQRFGDSNQAIFQSTRGTAATKDLFPGPAKRDLPRSYRFGQAIADLAKPLGVVPQELVGAGPSRSQIDLEPKGAAIFLFDDDSVSKVLAKFGHHLTQEFTEAQLQAGIFTAVAGVHNTEKDTPIPRSIAHYQPSYDPACTRRDAIPGTFAQFLARARLQMGEGHDLHPLVTATAEAVLQLASLINDSMMISTRRSPHRRIREALTDAAASQAYDQLLARVIATRGAISSDDWQSGIRAHATTVAIALSGEGDASGRIKDFMHWPAGENGDVDSSTSASTRSNVFSYPPDDPKVHVRLGSIHSVKGETHTATIVLDSFFRDHHLQQLKPWLLGTRTGGLKGKKLDSDTVLGRLRLHYVAMTRPTHMLCLAMRRDALDVAERCILEARGWAIIDCA